MVLSDETTMLEKVVGWLKNLSSLTTWAQLAIRQLSSMKRVWFGLAHIPSMGPNIPGPIGLSKALKIGGRRFAIPPGNCWLLPRSAPVRLPAFPSVDH